MWKMITPEFPVADVSETQQWFRDVLGFTISFTRESYGGVYYGSAEIFFKRAEAPWPSLCCCVRVDDADELYTIYRERGVKIVEDLASRPWGVREFTIEDPNGHLFRIGHTTRYA